MTLIYDTQVRVINQYNEFIFTANKCGPQLSDSDVFDLTAPYGAFRISSRNVTHYPPQFNELNGKKVEVHVVREVITLRIATH